MLCPKCSNDNLEGTKFCGECGAKLEKTCPKCGYSNPPRFKFCGDCGHSLRSAGDSLVDYDRPRSYTPKFLADKILTNRSAITGERKRVTVMFADVANFTPMSAKLDPEEVHQIMDGCFKIMMDEVHRYEGTINQFTGDGVMALFGAPIAHEDHAQRACHAALAIQKALGEYEDKVTAEYGVVFKMRIGINSGPVVVGAIGDDLRMDYTAVGDTTNIASRMEGLSFPGGILLSKNTQRLAKNYFDSRSLGKVEVKGKEKPQEVFELIKVGGATTRIEAAATRGLTRFVGREDSMATLMQVYGKAGNVEGQVVGVVGEAGVGKSRLLFEFRNRLPQGKYTFLEGRCIHFGSPIAYLPILDILRSYFGVVEGERETVVKERISEKVLKFDKELEHVLPPIHEILSLKVEDEAYLKLEPKKKRKRTFEALKDLFARESRERTLILAVEDLHWIDKTSEEFLDYFIGWLADSKVMLVLLYRPEYTHQLGDRSHFNRIKVDQLTLKSSAKLLGAILKGGKAAPQLRDLILNRAAGNPFYMEELTQTLLENGAIQKERNLYILAGAPSELQVPDTIQGIIASRIDRLEENLKRITQVASVIGREFAFRILQTIIGMRDELKLRLINLQRLEVIYEKNLFPELEYAFKHALIQGVAYDSLLRNRRKEIHEKIGNAIQEIYPERLEEFYEMLAYHYTKSGNFRKASRYSKLSGDKAIGIYSHWEALSFYKNAAEQLNRMPETRENKRKKLEIAILAKTPTSMLGFPEGTSGLYEEGVRLSRDLGDNKALAQFYAGLANHYSHKGEAQLALKYSAYAYEEAQKNKDIELMVPHAWALSVAYMSLGDYGKILSFSPNVIGLIEKDGRKSDSFAMPMNPYSVLCMYCGSSMGNFGNFEEGKTFLEKAIRNAVELNDIRVLGPVELLYGLLLIAKGDWEPATEYLQKGNKHSEAVKYLWTSGISQVGLGFAYTMLGEPETGRIYARDGLKVHRDSRVEMHLALSCYFSSFVHLELGDLDKALKLVDEALRLSQKNNDKANVGRSMILLGKVLGMTAPSKMDEAENSILQGIRILKELRAKALYSLGYLFLGELYSNTDGSEKAVEHLMTAEQMFENMGMNYWMNRTRKLLEII